MAVTIGKSNHLVFDGRAVSRTSPLNFSGKHRGPIEVCPDDLVDGRRGGRHATFHLGQMWESTRGHDARAAITEGRGRSVSMLRIQSGPVNRSTIQPWRGPRLEATKFKAQPLQDSGER